MRKATRVERQATLAHFIAQAAERREQNDLEKVSKWPADTAHGYKEREILDSHDVHLLDLWEVCLYWYCQHACITNEKALIDSFDRALKRAFPQPANTDEQMQE